MGPQSRDGIHPQFRHHISDHNHQHAGNPEDQLIQVKGDRREILRLDKGGVKGIGIQHMKEQQH